MLLPVLVLVLVLGQGLGLGLVGGVAGGVGGELAVVAGLGKEAAEGLRPSLLLWM